VPSSGAPSLIGTTTTPTPVTTSSELTIPAADSPQSLADRHGKENIVPNEDPKPVGNAKKRKAQADGKSAKRKHFKVAEDKSMVEDAHSQEKDALGEIGENGADEMAATRSGRKSNLPSRFKDAAPQKKTKARKNNRS
jgi:hypothetical protein